MWPWRLATSGWCTYCNYACTVYGVPWALVGAARIMYTICTVSTYYLLSQRARMGLSEPNCFISPFLAERLSSPPQWLAPRGFILSLYFDPRPHFSGNTIDWPRALSNVSRWAVEGHSLYATKITATSNATLLYRVPIRQQTAISLWQGATQKVPGLPYTRRL